MATKEEFYSLYNGEVKLRFLPNSHAYSIDGDRKLGVTGITGIINKEALMLWPLGEAITYLNRTLLSDASSDQTKLWTNKELSEAISLAATAYQKKQLRGTDAGTAGHAWLEEYLQAIKNNTDKPSRPEKVNIKEKFGDNPDKFNDEFIRANDHNNIVDAIDQFLEYMNNHDVEVLEVEKIVYSRKYDYCGKFDAILRIDGKVYLIDFKTSNPSREFDEGVYPENFSQLGGYDLAFTEEFPDFKIDGHAIFNLSKKTGKLSVRSVVGQEDVQKDRDFFIFTLGVKRGMQDRTKLLSNRYQDRKKK